MKNLINLLIIVFTINLYSQGDRFALGIYSEPFAYNDGFNIGASIEYQTPFMMYFKAQTFFFPNLNGVDYMDVEGVFGLNWRNRWDDFRIYGGVKGGGIGRDGAWGNGKFGLECGIETYFENGFFVGLLLSRDYRSDGDQWENDARNYWRNSGGIRIGKSW